MSLVVEDKNSLLTDAEWKSNARLKFGKGMIVFDGPLPQWAAETIVSICHLGGLEENWDSYGARAIDPHCVMGAIQFVLRYLDPNHPMPSIFPTNGGGVQLEWRGVSCELEIEFVTQSTIKFFFESASAGDVEDVLEFDFDGVVPYLSQLT